MAEVEYTEQALDHLDGLPPNVANRILNKVDEAADWPRTDSAPSQDIHTTVFGLATTG